MKPAIRNYDCPMVLSECHYERDHPAGVNVFVPARWVLNLPQEGVGLVRRGRSWSEVHPGDALLFAPGSHQLFAPPEKCPGWRFHWVLFEALPQMEELLDWPDSIGDVRLIRGLGDPLRKRTLRALHDLYEVFFHRSPPRRLQLCFNILERLLLWLDVANPGSRHAGCDPRIRRAVEHVEFHYAGDVSVDDLAAEAHLSASRFAHLFRSEIGVSPMRYVEQVRLRQARRLLETGHMTVSEVAEIVGFCNVYYFSSVFKRRVGIPPSDYRAGKRPDQPLAD